MRAALGLVVLLVAAPAGAQVTSSSVAEVRDAGAPDARPAPVNLPQDAGGVAVDAGVRRPPRKVKVPQRRAKARTAPLPRDAGAGDAATPDAGLALAPPVWVGPPAPPRPIRARPLPVPRLVKPEATTSTGSSVAHVVLWLLVIGALLMAGRTADVLAEHLNVRGSLPSILRLLATIARGLAVVLVVGMLFREAPGLADHLPIVLAVVGALGLFAGRDLLQDVLAHFVLRFEGRVHVGQHLESGHAQGRVVRLGLRATRVVDAVGRAADIPNHMLLEAPIFAESGAWPTREIVLRLPDGHGGTLRQALVDAARASPWVPIDAEISARRDAQNPSLWVLTAQLLDGDFTERFTGEISEQVEARLRAVEAESCASSEQ